MSSRVVRILGVDPGSRTAGVAVLQWRDRKLEVLHCDAIALMKGRTTHLHDRLADLHSRLDELVTRFDPHLLSIERIIFAKNVTSAIALGQARGVVLLLAAQRSLGLAEYSPTEIKRLVTGHGGATKEQVAHMVSIQTGWNEFKTPDASDALAVALSIRKARLEILKKRASSQKRQM